MLIKTLLNNSALEPLDAELLTAHVIKKPREYIVSHLDATVSFFQQQQIHRLFKKRKKGVPLAYLTGHKEFYGLDFFVNKHVLIPRPDTELMVSLALNAIQPLDNKKQIVLVDVGTGSGCIPISILKISEHKNIKAVATDVSSHALRVAKKNAKKYNVDITFLHGNLLEPVLKFKNNEIIQEQSSIIITANLPYLTEKQFLDEPSIQHEPKLALVAKNNGLALYEELVTQTQLLVTSYQLPVTLYFEIDPMQTERISAIMRKYFPAAKINVKKDLSGLDRVVCMTLY